MWRRTRVSGPLGASEGATGVFSARGRRRDSPPGTAESRGADPACAPRTASPRAWTSRTRGCDSRSRTTDCGTPSDERSSTTAVGSTGSTQRAGSSSTSPSTTSGGRSCSSPVFGRAEPRPGGAEHSLSALSHSTSGRSACVRSRWSDRQAPKSWVHQGPPVPSATPTPSLVRSQSRMFARWPGLSSQASITAAASAWP